MKVRGLWGLEIEPSKVYSLTVNASFRISMASINSFNGPERTSVFIEFQNQKFTLCSLIPEKIEQQVIDITCLEGEDILFKSKGPNCIHLTGNYVSPYDYDSADESSSESDVISVNSEEHIGTIGKHQNPSAMDIVKEESEVESDEEDDKEPEESEEDEQDEKGEQDEGFQMSAIYDYFNTIQSLNTDTENTRPDVIVEDEYSVVPENTADHSAISKSISGPTKNEVDETLNQEEHEIIEIPSGQTSDVEFDSREIHIKEEKASKVKNESKSAKKKKAKSEKEVSIVDKPPQSTKAFQKKSTPKPNEENGAGSNNAHNEKASEKATPKKRNEKAEIDKVNEKTTKKTAHKKAAPKKVISMNAATPKQTENPTIPPVVRSTPQQSESTKKSDTTPIPIPTINSSTESSNSTGSISKIKKKNAKKDELIPIPTLSSSTESTNSATSKSKKNSGNKNKSSKTNTDANKSKSKVKPSKPSTIKETTPPKESYIEKKSGPKVVIPYKNKLIIENTNLPTNKETTPENTLKKKESETSNRYPKRARALEFERTLKELAKGDLLMQNIVTRENTKKHKKKKLERSATNSPSTT